MQEDFANDRMQGASLFAKKSHAVQNEFSYESQPRPLLLRQKIEKLVLGLFSLAADRVAENIDLDTPIETYLTTNEVEPRFRHSVRKIIGELPSNILKGDQTLRTFSKYLLLNHTDQVEYLFGPSPRPVRKSPPLVMRAVGTQSAHPFAQHTQKPPADNPSIDAPKMTSEKRGDKHAKRKASSRETANRPSRNTSRRSAPPHQQPLSLDPGLASTDGVAIVGISGRFAQADNLEIFWQNLASGKTSIVPIPDNRPDLQALCAKGPSQKPDTPILTGGFLTEINKFDPLYFNLSVSYAEYMAPHERILVELVAIALENAGYGNVEDLGEDVGVYVATTGKYAQPYQPERGSETERSSACVNNIANRVSDVFNLQGPSMVIDAHHSSSLTALHLACQAIRNGEVDAALVGGVSLCRQPEVLHACTHNNVTLDPGETDDFEQDEDVKIMGEGGGVLLLKPLNKALGDKDAIQAVIRASTVAHVGAAKDHEATHLRLFNRLIANTYRKSGIDPTTISCIESHGLGSFQRDQLEIENLHEVFANHKCKCALGNVDKNIGNLENAAGIAGLLKLILQLKYRKILPSPRPHPTQKDIPLAEMPFHFPKQTTNWATTPAKGKRKKTLPRRAALSSFSPTGNHAHVILEEAPINSPPKSTTTREPVIITLSSHSREHLQVMTKELLKYVVASSSTPDAQVHDLASLAFTLQVGRRLLDERVAFVVSSIDDFKRKLKQLEETNDLDNIGFVGSVAARNKAADILLEGSTGQKFVDDLLEGGVLHKLAFLWTNGIEIDWRRLYSQLPYRISLPTFPFQRRHFVLPKPTSPDIHPASMRAATEQENQFILRELTSTLAEMLWLSEQDLQEDVALNDFGIDTELANRFGDCIQDRFGIRLHESTITPQTTLQRLAAKIADFMVDKNLPIKQVD